MKHRNSTSGDRPAAELNRGKFVMWHDACRRWRIGVPDHALTVGALTAARGEKRFGVNEFTIDGRPYRLPTWLINGDHDGPTLVVTAGVHAAEYASIAAALEFGRRRCPSLPRA